MSICYRKLGEILVDIGILLEEDLAKAVALQKSTKARLGEIIVSMGWAREADITHCLAEQYSYEVVDLTNIVCDPQTLGLISDRYALRNLILPVKTQDGFLSCVVADPINIVPIDELRSAQDLPLQISLAPPSELRDAIIQQYFKKTDGKEQTAPLRKQKIDNQTDRIALLHSLEYEHNKENNRRQA